MRTRALVSGGRSLLLVLALLARGCGGEEDVPGGAADLPGPVPEGVAFRDPPAGALAAPPFSLSCSTARRSAGRAVVEAPARARLHGQLVLALRGLHRQAAAAVDAHGDAVALLGLVPEDDAGPAVDYAKELDLGYPVAVGAGTRLARLRGTRAAGVVLVSRGGKVLRGWPGGVARAVLARRLGELVR